MSITYTINTLPEVSTVSGKMYLTIPQSEIVVNITGATFSAQGTFGFRFDFGSLSSIQFRAGTYDGIDTGTSGITWEPTTNTTVNKGGTLSFNNNVVKNTSSLFHTRNKTSREIRHQVRLLSVWWNNAQGYAEGYVPDGALTIKYVLDAPPTYSASTTSSAPYIKGITTYNAQISNAVAQYGGDIVASTLTIGNQKVTGSGNGALNVVLNEAGEFTPIVSVTDSRGQVTTKTLEPITVYENYIPFTVLNTQALTKSENSTYGVTNGFRVDMLLDCERGGNTITGVSPQMTLYNMDDSIITFPFVSASSLYRCYAIISAPNQAPASNFNITVLNPAMQYVYTGVGYPSTATPTQIKQEGSAGIISPQIHAKDIIFNPEGTGLNLYDVFAFIGNLTSSATKAQANADNDIKHIVTHASNVTVDDATTLQDWITEQYNKLI